MVLLFILAGCKNGGPTDDNKIKTEKKERFIEILDRNTKFDCYIQFDSVGADVDIFPDITKKDSFNFEIEYWDKNDFIKFIKVLKRDCLNGNLDSINLNTVDRILFNGSDKISIEINEIFRKDTLQEETFVIYGNNCYAIISYKEKMNYDKKHSTK